ncbi:hypothetical protein KVR01_008448 [Diaporthe batatas]|uniref:uncharacterized protein n=1 Tax=Diaporthe batatas TaxID=748121 RepID=UPI001D059098|nr:uncharacterized protein KVR01_008448 [Diaporthe batatas]KAG8161461.1 hypothetical protein KVR01_008448 [Diaporthe batatas]
MSRQPVVESPSRASRRSLLGTTKTTLIRRIQSLSLTDVEEQPTDEDSWGPLGLTLLHEPSEPLIDFIFVHGLGGGSRKTWSKTSNSAHYWPKEWPPTEPRFKNVRIHSFGYSAVWKERHASMLTIHDFGQALLSDVRNSPLLCHSDTPIVLVGHSMGGLVIKKMLLLAKQDPAASNIAARIHTLFFLATPHRGSNLANTLNNLLKLAIGHGPKSYVDNLYPDSEAITAINDQFRHVFQGINLYSFFETMPTALGLIVEKTSAVLDLPGEQISHLNADHSQMCKFDTPNDSNYTRLRDAFVASISLIEKTCLAPRYQRRNDDVEKLTAWLGVKESPETDVANIIEHQSQGSCAWLTEKDTFQEWLVDGNGFSRFYWLSGEPATGKSTLAAHVVNYLEHSNKDCSYFFFRNLHTGKSTVADMLLSLAVQMARTNTTIRERLLEMHDSGTLDHQDERSIWRTLFVGRILRISFQQLHYWVIDGLDESSNPAAFFPLVAKIEKHIPLRIFVTSRPSLVFERAFSRENISSLRVAETIPLDATKYDIGLYLNEHASYFLAESEAEREALVQTILDMSNGNFLWTDLVVKKIENAVSQEQVQNILNSVPKEMDELYSEITTSIMASSETGLIAKAILRWTLCSMRPLFVDELREALRLDIRENLNQLDKTAGTICGNLIYVDRDSRVQATHQTVRDFFFNHIKGGSDYGMSREREHFRIAEICLSYLGSTDMKPPRFRRAKSLAQKKEPKRSSFSSYAVTFFSDHIARSTSSSSTLLTSLDDFLMSNSMAWIEAVAKTSDLSPLTRTAKNVKAYMDRRAKYESPLGSEVQNVLAWANDLVYLVAQFGKTLVASPQAIYHLIPAVCPKKSILFRAFKGHPRGLQVVGLEQDDWDERLGCIVIPDTQILSIACEGNNFALGTANGKVIIYDESTFQEKIQLQHGEPVRRLCFGTTYERIVSQGRKLIKSWDIATGKQVWTFLTRDEPLSLSFSEDEKQLYTATRANYALVIDIDTGKRIDKFAFGDWNESQRQYHKYQKSPMHADFMMNLGLLGVTYRLRPVTFWDLEEQEFVGHFTRSTNSSSLEPYIHAFLFNPNPEINLAAVSYQDGSTHVFDPEIQKTQAIAQTDASVLAASPDGTVLAVGSGNGFIKLYDFETMKLLHQTFVSQRAIRAITFNSSGQRLFEVRSNTCSIWEPSALVRRNDNTNDDSSIDISDRVSQAAPMSIAKTIDNEKAITALVPHHDGECIFCGRGNGSVAAYSAKSGKMAQELFHDSKNVTVDFLDWNKSRDLLIVADRSGQVYVRTVQKNSAGAFSSNKLSLSVRCEGVIDQILVKADGEKMLISTADSLEVWDLISAAMVSRHGFAKPSLPRRLANHPDNETIMCFEGTSCQLCTWATIEDLFSTDNPGTEFLAIVDPKLSPKGNVIMAVEDEIAIFHNGLDFEEKVPV